MNETMYVENWNEIDWSAGDTVLIRQGAHIDETFVERRRLKGKVAWIGNFETIDLAGIIVDDKTELQFCDGRYELNEEDLKKYRESIHDIHKKMRLQQKYVESANLPRFAPSHGICAVCHKQIYEKITKESAAGELINGCPYCGRAWDD